MHRGCPDRGNAIRGSVRTGRATFHGLFVGRELAWRARAISAGVFAFAYRLEPSLLVSDDTQEIGLVGSVRVPTPGRADLPLLLSERPVRFRRQGW